MTPPNVTQDDIAARIAAEVDAAGGVRQLARQLAESDDKRAIDRWRRNLYRYMDGGQPKEKSALVMSKRLGKPSGWFRTTQKPKDRTIPQRVQAVEKQVAEINQAVERIERHLSGEGGDKGH